MRKRGCQDRAGKGVIPDHFEGARRSACFRAPVGCSFREKESQVGGSCCATQKGSKGAWRLIRKTESSPYCILLPGFD